MKSIFNAKTAIVTCLAVTGITLSSFTHTSDPKLLGSNNAVNIQAANNSQLAKAAPVTVVATPIPTTFTRTVIPRPITTLPPRTLIVTTSDIPPIITNPIGYKNDQVALKMSRLD